MSRGYSANIVVIAACTLASSMASYPCTRRLRRPADGASWRARVIGKAVTAEGEKAADVVVWCRSAELGDQVGIHVERGFDRFLHQPLGRLAFVEALTKLVESQCGERPQGREQVGHVRQLASDQSRVDRAQAEVLDRKTSSARRSASRSFFVST